MTNYLDIDYLRSVGTPTWFGLGFFQLKISPTERLHFWHPAFTPDAAHFEEEFHTHRYDFSSTVLIGSAKHDIATMIPVNKNNTAHELLAVCCAGNGTTSLGYAIPKIIVSVCLSEGSSYYLPHDTFHRLSVPSGYGVTLQTRTTSVITEKALVLRPRGADDTNPFSSKHAFSHAAWDAFEEILAFGNKKKIINPGYHLSDIPKGELGEVSKILEEVRELQDAEEQGVRLMALNEASDIMGALSAYMDKHHPGYTMADLISMANVTARAFKSGRR